MVEALPEGGDREAIEAAARTMIGIPKGIGAEKEKVPVREGDDSDGES